MSNYRDFDAMLNESAGSRPEFTLAGQKFTCRAKLPWKKFQVLLATMGTGDNIEETERFFHMVLVRDDRDRFKELINRDEDDYDDDELVNNYQVGKLLEWLLPFYIGKSEETGTEDTPTVPEQTEASEEVVPMPASLNANG